MEKSSKKEYIALPTSDLEEAVLPAYEETNPAVKTQKSKTVRFLLIGGAIALLGLTHLCTSNYMYQGSEFQGDALAEYQDREPCALKHLEQYNALKEHMSDLKESFGGYPHERRPDFESMSGPPHHGHHGHHKFTEQKEHREHKHKNKHHKGHKHHDEPAPPTPPPSDDTPENMWVEDSTPNEDVPPPPPHKGHGKHHHKEHPGKEHKPKHHKHKHHKGKKNPDEPAPPTTPAPPGELSLNRWTQEESDPAFDMEGHKKKKHGKKHNKKYPQKPFCKIENLQATSTVFKFSTEEFQRAGVFLSGYFSRGGHVRLSKSSDKSITDVKVNVTLYTGRDELKKEVKLSAFDHEGQYAVQIERGHFKGALPPKEDAPIDAPPADIPVDGPPADSPSTERHEHGRIQKKHHDDDKEDHKQENCLVYNVDIEFPSHIDYFEDLQLHIKSAQRIEGGAGLKDIEFGSVHAGLGRGAIIFDGLRAKKLVFGVLNGVVMGTYQPGESFAAGVIHGAAKVNIEPTNDNVNITASSTFGPASVDLPADSFKGKFTLFNLFGETSTITAPNPEDIHVTKFRPTLKTGYYKEETTDSHIIVSAKLHGGETLSFN